MRTIGPGGHVRALLLAALLLAPACRPAEQPSAERPSAEQPRAADTAAAEPLVRRPATLQFHGDSARVTVPPSGTMGQPVRVALTTYGGGCVREDTTEVRVRGLVAEVMPYQLAPRPGSSMICTMELRLTRREVDVVFAERGRATVRIVGVRQPGDSAMRIERQVVVR